MSACLITQLPAQNPVGEIIVRNDGQPRDVSYTRFEIPTPLRSSRLHAQDARNQPVQLQVVNGTTAWLRVDQLSANEERVFQLHRGASHSGPTSTVSAHRVGNKVEFWSGKRRILDYQAEPGAFPRDDIGEAYRRGGYLHPVWSPKGVVITDDFPPDHVHHHGIWFPWTKTRFEGREPDFWNMGDGSGRVEFVHLDGYAGGSVFGEMNTTHRFVDLLVDGGRTVLNEKWNVKVFNAPEESGVSIFDLESTQTCATEAPLFLPEYRYGGLGFRGHGDWNGAANAHFLTANGETDRVKGHATRANWCYVGGDTAGQRAGVVIMCHPDNFRAPQPMRLHPTEPFFCFAPQQAGDMSIEPGQPYVSKYRFLVLDGEPDADLINRYWHDYANPLKADVTLK